MKNLIVLFLFLSSTIALSSGPTIVGKRGSLTKGVASKGNPGLVYFRTDKPDLSASAFTSGTVLVTRIGNMVTISWDTLGHASAATVTGSGVIPTWARPTTGLRTIVTSYSNSVSVEGEFQTDGDLVFRYHIADGTANALTALRINNLVGGSFSYITESSEIYE